MPSSKFSPESLPDLAGKVYLVTGGNAGIGKATVVGLASHGAKVWMGARSEDKALVAIQEIKAQLPSAQIVFLQLDLSSLDSVVDAAKKIRRSETKLHGLVNNAGIMGVPYSVTADGYEVQLQTNYISHWLLTYHLLPLLTATAASSPDQTARIVNVTSDGHSFAPKTGINFDDMNLTKESTMIAMTRYGQSKLANILHAKELHRRFGPPQARLLIAAVHPGHIDTDLNKKATGTAPASVMRIAVPIMRCLGVYDDQVKGSWSSLFAIASDEFTAADSGAYVVPYAKIAIPSAHAQDAALAGKLWEWTEGEMAKRRLLDTDV